MKSLISVAFLLLLFSGFKSRESSANIYADDFHILIQSLRELYPMAYHVMGKDSFVAKAKTVYSRLENVHTKNDAIYLMQEFMYELGDAHASIVSSYGDLGVNKILPFKVHILDDKLYIRNFPEAKYLEGKEITAIDHIPASVVIDSLKIFYPNDGKRDVPGFGLPALFNSLYSAFCHESDAYVITIDSGDTTVLATERGEPLFSDLLYYDWMSYTRNDSSFECSVNDSYGYFRFSDFARMEEGHNVEQEFNLLLAGLNDKGITNLVIDLRYNSGGDPYIAGRMATHFTTKPFKVFQRLMLTNTKHATYASYMVQNYQYRFRHVGTKSVNGQRVKVNFERGLQEWSPSALHFSGNVYVLTASMTGSSATMLCNYLQGLPNVQFVGSETEGATNYFCAHRHCELTLPNSRIYVNFGMQIVELKNGSSDQEKPTGLIPENLVHYSIEELMSGTDKEMEWVRNDIGLRSH